MAFALGTTAGAGTISIVAGGSIVTGVGTNFLAANVGAILVVGAQWGVIATRTSTTSITLDRPFTTAVTGSAYTISANIPVITQTGTDTSLSGLTGVPGVTVSPSTISILYTITSATLVVSGSLIYNRLLNRLRFLNSASILTGSTSLPAMRITGTFNNSVSQSINGYSFKSPSYAILFESNPISNSGAGNFIGTTSTSTSVFEGNIEFNLSTGTSPQTFVLEGNTTLQNGSIINATVSGFNVQFTTTAVASTLTVNNYNSYGCGMRVLSNTTNINNYLSVGAAGAINQASSAAVNNPIYAGLQDGGGSIGWRTVNNSLKYFQLLNFASSRSSLIGLAQGNATANSQTLQTNSLIVTAQDSTGVVQDMKLWAKDSNNGNRCSANYGAGLGFEIATTGDLTYTGLTNASGVATFPSIISAIYWQAASGVNASYKVDHRGNGGATSQNLIFYACSYNHNLAQQSPDMWAFNNATGLYNTSTSKEATYLLLADTSITETDPTIVAAYTTLSTNAELYDFAKYFLYTNFAGQTATYVTGTGNAGSYNIIINTAAAAVFDFTGSSIVIKTSSFDGDLTTSGSLILAASSVVTNGTFSTPNIIQDIPTALTGVVAAGNLNYNTNTPITITFTDCDIQGTVNNSGSAQVNITLVNSTIGTIGANVVAQQFATISAPNLISGTRVRVYDEDNAVELYNDVLAGAGFSESFVYTSDTTVTLTATYTSGATAKLGLSATGIFTSSGVTFLASQQDDTVYNGYAINGSTVTGFTADYAQDDVNLSMATNFTAESLYAWWVYTLTTEDGIRNFFGGITALDSANIQINVPAVSIFLDNSTANFIYQTDTIRLFRSDGAYPAKTVTTGGGGIQANWNSNVYVGTADISALNNISAADVLTQASAALTTYDAPTKAELDSAVSGLATLSSISALNNISANDVLTQASAALTTYDAPTKAELDTVQASIESDIAALNNVSVSDLETAAGNALATYDAPTKAELDAAQTSIESDIAALNNISTSAIRTELATELGNLDASISSRLATASYTAPDNASITSIKAKSDLLTFTGSELHSVAKTVEDKVGYTLTTADKENIATLVELSLLDETDGQKIIEAIVNAIGNENIDEIALVSAIRADLERVGGSLDSLPTLAEIESSALAKEATVSSLNNISASDVQTAAATALSSYNVPTKANLTVVNDGVKKASLLIPHSDDID